MPVNYLPKRLLKTTKRSKRKVLNYLNSTTNHFQPRLVLLKARFKLMVMVKRLKRQKHLKQLLPSLSNKLHHPRNHKAFQVAKQSLSMPFKTTITKKCSKLIKLRSNKSNKWKMQLKKCKRVSKISCLRAQEPREHSTNIKMVFRVTFFRLT